MNPKEEILKKLYSDPYSEEKIFQDFSKNIPKEEYELLYSYLIDILCDVEIDRYEAKQHFENICKHREEMERILGRSVGFRVGMLDYFVNKKRKLQNPKVIELATYENKLKLADVDELTGLYNRRYLQKMMNTEIQRSRRYDLTFSVLFIDLDNFKRINDDFDHAMGDSVLKDFSYIISRVIRAEDVAARYGGEEFVILIPQTDSLSAKILYKRIRDEVEVHTFEHRLPLTFSAGVTEYPLHGRSVDVLLNKADQAMYMSKHSGKNKLTVLKEKRDSKRYAPKKEITISLGGVQNEPGEVLDVSLGGLSFEAARHLEVGELVSLTLVIPTEGRRIELKTQIVWVKEHEAGLTKMGARFEHESSTLLVEIIKRISVA